MAKRATIAIICLLFIVGVTGVAQAGSAYTLGDVFLGINNIGVNEYTPTGTLVQTINHSALSGFATGMAFQNNGNLLVTAFTLGKVVQYDNKGNLLNNAWASGIGFPESFAINSSQDVYVSSVGKDGIREYTSSGGTAIGTSIAGTRTDWIDLAADQKTMLYTDEGGMIHSVNVATNTSNPDFCTSCGKFALRIIPSGPDAGDVLAADSNGANLIDASGTILQTYKWTQNNGTDFALNIDPNGTAFWTADEAGDVAEFDIASGTLLNHWSDGKGAQTFGLVVFGQLTASGGGGGGGTPTPEPATTVMLAVGLAVLATFQYRRRRATI